MNKFFPYLIVVLALLVGITFIIVSINFIGLTTEGKYVDCYDNNNNKILNEVCYEEGLSIQESSLNSFILFMLGFICLSCGIYIIFNKEGTILE